MTGFYFYTTKLFIYIFIFAILILFVCIIFSIYIFYLYFAGELADNAGWSTITILVLFFGSISLLLNSVLLFILTKIFDYSSKKPNYIKKFTYKDEKKINFDDFVNTYVDQTQTLTTFFNKDRDYFDLYKIDILKEITKGIKPKKNSRFWLRYRIVLKIYHKKI